MDEKKIDIECQALCDAVNLIQGLMTVESCCGHGNTPFHIYFRCDSLKNLPDLLYWLDGCHSGFYGWKCYVKTDCAKGPPVFCIEGPIGAFIEAEEIAKLIKADQ